MDPASQQFMWNLILQLRKSRRTVIITSHSMEECEKLCTKVAIMVKGQFQCIGPIQHLKQRSVLSFHINVFRSNSIGFKGRYLTATEIILFRFGDGYSLTLKFSDNESSVKGQEFMTEFLPKARV